MVISAIAFEASALDVEGKGKTVLSRFSLESLRLCICFSQCSIYCEEENLHFRVPLILPPRLPSLGSAENWKTFLGCCFGQFVERQGLHLFPKLSGGGCCCCKAAPKKELPVSKKKLPPIPKPIVTRHFHFEALQASSSDLNSRLIYALGMYTEAQKTGEESYVQTIITWIRANGGSGKSNLLEQDIIRLTDLSIQAPSMRTLASTLRDMRKVRFMILQHANIDAVATRILCEGLRNSDLIILDLQKNRIGSGGAQAIGSMKMIWVNLAILHLNDPTSDPIGPDGAKALFEPPDKNQEAWDKYPEKKSYLDSLESVCVGGHKITDEGVRYVVEAFEIMKKLQRLYLYENEITDQGAGVIMNSIRLTVSLIGISTRGNAMSSATEAELQQTLAGWVRSRSANANSEQIADPRVQQMKREAVVLRTLPNQPPGVEQIIIQEYTLCQIEMTYEKVQFSARIGSTGKHYCGRPLNPLCVCCDGYCGPTNGCNCESCMRLDIIDRALPAGSLVNRDGRSSKPGVTMNWYCGAKITQNEGSYWCRPTNGEQCLACQILQSQVMSRYLNIANSWNRR